MDELIKTTFYSTQKENRTKEKIIAYCLELEQLCGFKIFQFNYDASSVVIFKTLCTMCSSYDVNEIDDDIYNYKAGVCRFLLKLPNQSKHHFTVRIVQYVDY
jgi:hypothetical protein